MDAKELRIGNIILKDGEEIIVSSYTFYNVEKDNESYEPIELTEEWLNKFGFDKKIGEYENAETYDFLFGFLYFDMANQSIKINGKYCLSFIPEYVHQLQNLYFALTGEELKLN